MRINQQIIQDDFHAPMTCTRDVESWLQTQVGPAYDALKADPLRAVNVDQVRKRLAAEHKKTSTKD